MNHLANFVMVCIFAISGCANGEPPTTQGEGEIRSSEIVDDTDVTETDTCPNRTRNLLETCTNDCDCAEGLHCSPCVNTDATNCVEYCKSGDPFCNGGVATCPIGAGLECPSVHLCQ